MNTLLDAVRRQLGLSRTRSSFRQGDWTLPTAGTVPEPRDVIRAGDYPVEALSFGIRRMLSLTTVLSGAVAITHQLLTTALGPAHGTGVLSAAHALLTWPLPLAQPILAGVGALVLGVIGLDTRGWRRVSRRQGWYLLAFTVAAVAGAGPMVLVCVLFAAAVAFAIALGVMIFLALLVLLLVTR
jgi:hypothetical protein